MAMNEAMAKLLADEEGSTVAPLDLRFGDRVLVPIGKDKHLAWHDGGPCPHVFPGVRCVVLDMSCSHWDETGSVSIYYVREDRGDDAWHWTEGYDSAGHGHLVERHIQPVDERLEVWP